MATVDNTDAVAYGAAHTARLISGAAILMVVVFGAFAFTGLVPIQQLGFVLAIAVAIDATIVRLVLVPRPCASSVLELVAARTAHANPPLTESCSLMPVIAPPSADPIARQNRKASQLLVASARRSFDPRVDIDWDTPLDPGKWFVPEKRCTLYGTERWASLTLDQRLACSREELASSIAIGVWTEYMLLQMVARYRVWPRHHVAGRAVRPD